MISSHRTPVDNRSEIQIESEADHAAAMESESCPDCGLPLNACDNHWAPGTTRRAWIGCPNVTAQEIAEDQ
jgi:hypothetical protein